VPVLLVYYGLSVVLWKLPTLAKLQELKTKPTQGPTVCVAASSGSTNLTK